MLVPFAEIVPDVRHPLLKQTIAELLARTEDRRRGSARGCALEGELLAGELETVEIADDGSGDLAWLEKSARELLHFFGSDAFQHGNQLFRREIPVEIEMVAREAAHAGAAAFERQQSGALQVILGAAKLFFIERLLLHAPKFVEDRAHHLRRSVERRRVDRERSRIAIGIHLAENRIRQALPLANILK